MAYGAAITAPSPNVWELMAMSYIPPALSLNLPTRSLRSASSPWLYQYVALSRMISGGWPAASDADCLARICGEPGIDCHWTLMPPFFSPQATKASPIALSVSSFQFAENQMLKTPDATWRLSAEGVAAAAAA